MLRVCRFGSPRGEMDIIQVSGTWGLGSIPGEGISYPQLKPECEFDGCTHHPL